MVLNSEIELNPNTSELHLHSMCTKWPDWTKFIKEGKKRWGWGFRSYTNFCGNGYLCVSSIPPNWDITTGRVGERLLIPRNPNAYQHQITHLNRLVRESDQDCHDNLRVYRHTFMTLCGLIRSFGLGDCKNVVLEEKVAIFLCGSYHIIRRIGVPNLSFGDQEKQLASISMLYLELSCVFTMSSYKGQNLYLQIITMIDGIGFRKHD